MGHGVATDGRGFETRRRASPARIFAYAAFGVAVLLSPPIAYLADRHWVNAPDPGELTFHDSFGLGDLRAWGGLGERQLCCDYSAQVDERHWSRARVRLNSFRTAAART